jgi:hypothetical protein
MANIQSTSDIYKSVAKERATKAQRRFTHAVLPLYGVTEVGEPEHLGSSFAVKVEEKYVLITAAHIFDKSNYTAIYVSNGQGFIEFPKQWFVTNKPEAGRGDDKFDLAFASLGDAEVADIGPEKFLQGEKLRTPNHTYEVGSVFMCSGYPNSKNKKIDRAKDSMLVRRYHYTGMFSQSMQSKFNLLGLNKSYHLIVEHDEKSFTDEKGKKTNGIALRGMSGGLITYLGRVTDLNILKGVDYGPILIAGMLIEYHKSHNSIVALRFDKIIEQIQGDL